MKDKLRVYEYAKSLNMSSKEIITILKRLDLPVNNHMSVMEPEMVQKVEGFFRDIKANAAAKRAQEAKPTNQDRQGPMKSINMTTQTSEQKQNTNTTVSNQSQPKEEKQAATQSVRTAERPAGRSNNNTGAQRSSSNQQGGNRGGQHRSNQEGSSNQSSQAGRSAGQGQGGNRSHSNHGGGQKQQNNTRTDSAARSNQQQPQGRTSTEDKTNRSEDRYSSNNNSSNRGKGGQRKFDDNNSNRQNNFRGNNRNNRGRNNRQAPQPPREKIDNTPKKIIVRGTLTVGDLAKLLHKDASEVIKKLMFLGVLATINQEVEMEAIQLIADEYGVEVEVKIPVEEDAFETIEEVDDDADLKLRPAVVTIMGHVDHGKTTLLDSIRKTNVSSGEAGGITQHIGAYQVEINGKKITFLDTPGHEAFTLMRARGAQVTDITIIVVAADDGIMPQTVEAISHAKAAGVPIIVAVNKIDKPEANIDRIKQEMTEYELVPEEWGGDTIFVEISAKQRIGIEGLLEMILLVAEVNDFKANPNKRARGTVIEAELDKGKGPVVRILVQHGTLRIGDAFVAGNCFGRVRAMVSDRGRRLKEAGPSTPVEITGLTEVPHAGDPFLVFEDERKARTIAERRAVKHRQSEIGANTRVTLDDLYNHIKEGEIKDLNVIIKADVQGSSEALKGSLAKIEVEGVRVKIIHSGVGAITESDVILASASNAIVIGFNVRPDPQAEATIASEKVDVRMHRVIYSAIEEIEQAMKGLLDPIYKEVVIGHAEVRNVFKVTRVGAIAGCMVTDGKVARNAEARVVRSGIVVYTGKVDSLKRFKDDAKEVSQGFECGITLERFSDFKEGDIIEAFVMETVER
ncbi:MULTISPECIES: translation initiation factor IF-2 [unclassified Paenibacillus]|uniref:translation initiation factor IF-2 n=1 Tax=unclassified Paenibacillus TaxID=185978 RepID=UPI002F419DBE